MSEMFERCHRAAVVRYLVCVSMLAGMLLPGGCIAPAFGPGGARWGAISTNVTYPGRLNPAMNHKIRLERRDIELLGRVSTTAESYNIAGAHSAGNSGYGALLEAARAKGADGVMNVSVDNQVEGYFWVLVLITGHLKVTTTLTGMAYRYAR